MKTVIQSKARALINPVVGWLANVGVPPLLVSLFGLAISLYGAVVVAEGSLFMGGVFLLIAGLCDVIDGDLARKRGQTSVFGAFIDSTLDRVAEFAYFSGILFYMFARPAGVPDYDIAVVLVSLAGSVLTSYARARAEGLGLECKVGLLERPERIALLTFGLVFGYRVLVAMLTVIAVASVFTFLQRIIHVYRVTRDDAASRTDDAPAAEESTSSDHIV